MQLYTFIVNVNRIIRQGIESSAIRTQLFFSIIFFMVDRANQRATVTVTVLSFGRGTKCFKTSALVCAQELRLVGQFSMEAFACWPGLGPIISSGALAKDASINLINERASNAFQLTLCHLLNCLKNRTEPELVRE